MEVNNNILSKKLQICRQWLMDKKKSLHLGKIKSILFGPKKKKVESQGQKMPIKKHLGLQIDNDLAGIFLLMIL